MTEERLATGGRAADEERPPLGSWRVLYLLVGGNLLLLIALLSLFTWVFR